ncbi:GvpL/GvpF family gas vesicle protein [Metabacillus indicus]|uniref:GvpL/GvpF family gas vesicle protein n=1 Tax=Metabacillus indicus TaxID=246786 RepID=UPI00049395C4|nr:GvpL/GvpF family gas vesicle protein [Metabacillus indicus]KEZ48142.1 gas vesicle protein GvpL [Metabacillus indicus LMG 22858]
MDDLIYLYGLIPSDEADHQSFPSFKGFDGEKNIYTIPAGDVTAVVCRLDSEQFSEEAIKDKIDNDMEWLQEKAFHHHETVTALYKSFTIIPLKFCTIYKSEESLKQTIEASGPKISETLQSLKGNEEWNVKIYSDDPVLKKKVGETHPAVEEKLQEISVLPKGRQFFEKKKIDKLIEDELENEKNRVCEQLHEQLKQFALHAAIKKNWNKDVTGLKENMAWNSVFLLQSEKVETFLEEMKQADEKLGGTGWRIEATGPWPAYHFSSF